MHCSPIFPYLDSFRADEARGGAAALSCRSIRHGADSFAIREPRARAAREGAADAL